MLSNLLVFVFCSFVALICWRVHLQTKAIFGHQDRFGLFLVVINVLSALLNLGLYFWIRGVAA